LSAVLVCECGDCEDQLWQVLPLRVTDWKPRYPASLVPTKASLLEADAGVRVTLATAVIAVLPPTSGVDPVGVTVKH